MRHALLLTLVAACQGAPEPPPVPPPDPAAICRGLLAAAPSDWVARVPTVLALGADAAPVLIAALEASPTAPGGQAAVAVLGRLGNPRAIAFLQRQINDRTELATEAALALAELRATAAEPDLRVTAADRLADPTLRTACACALIRLGHRRDVALLIRAVLLAGTPGGALLQQEMGLPPRPRWAHERYLIQRELLVSAGTDFGLDTDAPWNELQRAAERVTAWLEGRP